MHVVRVVSVPLRHHDYGGPGCQASAHILSLREGAFTTMNERGAAIASASGQRYCVTPIITTNLAHVKLAHCKVKDMISRIMALRDRNKNPFASTIIR